MSEGVEERPREREMGERERGGGMGEKGEDARGKEEKRGNGKEREKWVLGCVTMCYNVAMF